MRDFPSFFYFGEKMARQYTDLDKVSKELNGFSITGSSVPSTATVTNWIEEETAGIEDMFGKVYGSVSFDIYIDYNGQDEIRLPVYPVLSIGTLSYDNSTLGQTRNWQTLTENTDFILYDKEGIIKLITSVIPSGSLNVRVIGYQGTSSVPTNVQKLCTLLVAKRVMNSILNGQGTSEGGTITVDVITISDNSAFSLGNIKRIDADIDRLVNSIGTFRTFRLRR